MSSMRNAVQRRNHKERAQPLERQKWGLLEKHKDYTLRAKDHNDKKRRLKILRQKGAQRNPDEFAFGMITRTTHKGVQQSTRKAGNNGGQEAMKMDVVKLLKTQDVGYLQTIVQQTRLAREKAEKRLVLLRVGAGVGVEGGVLGKGTRMMFDEDGELVVDKKKKSQVALDDDDHHDDEEMDMDMDMDNMDLDDLDDLTDLYDGESEQNDGKSADKVKNGKSTDDGKSEDKVKNGKSTNDTTNLSKEEIRQRRKKVRAQEVLQKYLQALTEREHDLTAALTQLQEQRARMSNSVGGVNKEGVKFKVRERKR